jgi:broad specificity phosphatase PhoE
VTVLLARHGQTDDNLEPIRVQGFRDTPLNDVGREQARALAQRLALGGVGRREIGSLWSSDLSRASETASIVGERLGLPVRLDPRLREGNRGRWEGRLFIEIERDEPELYQQWRRAGSSWRFPGGESLVEQQERVCAAIKDARTAGPLPALLVCHGGSIRAILARSDPRGLDAFHTFDVPNTAVFEL